MVEIICSRSGLKFEAPNRRLKVHPEISWYTAHNNTEVRYPAIAVIERGKSEGWDSIQKFEAEIKKALVPKPRPDYDFEGHWLARIEGWDAAYDYQREFAKPVDIEGRFKRFWFQGLPDGLYETGYKSNAGNKTYHYYQVVDGARTEISKEELEALLPSEKPEKQPWKLSHSLPFAETQEETVEECWECGARYRVYGYVEPGRMGCRRCD